jgi:hypothetical protein
MNCDEFDTAVLVKIKFPTIGTILVSTKHEINWVKDHIANIYSQLYGREKVTMSFECTVQ